MATKTMRKDCKVTTKVDVANVQTYHGGHWNSEGYAFEGFKENKEFTSDRTRPTRLVNGRLMAVTPNGDLVELKDVGLEIETECKGVLNHRLFAQILKHSLFPMFPDDLFKMQHDSSLGYDIDCWNCSDSDDFEQEMAKQCVGIECITQPMSIAFIRNNYRNFKAMYDTLFPDLGISCSDSGRCGMHVNLSNALFGKTEKQQKEAIRKLHYFVNKHFDFCCRLFKRDRNNTGYCSSMYYGNKEYCKTMEFAGCGSHGSSLNYTHFDSGRIELRLVGGQPDFNSFRNTMECVFFLVNRMRTISWDDLDDMVKVFHGCNQYVAKRIRYCGLMFDTYDAIRRNAVNEDYELA